MRRVRVGVCVLLSMGMFACSSSRGGQAKPDNGADRGDGNIPYARSSSEIPDISFDFDSSSLSSGAQSTLRDGAKWMQGHSGASVQIEGHCDERGTNEYNLALGERRARSAYDYLRTLGVKKDQLSTISYGEELPLDPGHDESAWSKNRRDHFSIKK